MGSLLQYQVDAAGFAQVPFVQLGDNLIHCPRHGLEALLSAAVNGVGTFKRDHIAIPVGALLARIIGCDLLGIIHSWRVGSRGLVNRWHV